MKIYIFKASKHCTILSGSIFGQLCNSQFPTELGFVKWTNMKNVFDFSILLLQIELIQHPGETVYVSYT